MLVCGFVGLEVCVFVCLEVGGVVSWRLGWIHSTFIDLKQTSQTPKQNIANTFEQSAHPKPPNKINLITLNLPTPSKPPNKIKPIGLDLPSPSKPPNSLPHLPITYPYKPSIDIVRVRECCITTGISSGYMEVGKRCMLVYKCSSTKVK